jgi:hypothetical protein
VLRLKAKARSFAFLGAADDRRATAAVAVALHNNTLEVHELTGGDATQRHAVDLPGHRYELAKRVCPECAGGANQRRRGTSQLQNSSTK